MAVAEIKALLLDIGGVLMTKGWGRESRRKAAETFGLDYDQMRERHDLIFHTYEEGRITLDQYLHQVVFYEERDFTAEKFKEFIFAQSQPFPDAIEVFSELKAKYRLKVVALSNEGREITEYRIHAFGLVPLIDFFVCSCYVGTRKPDPAIFQFAMDQVQIHPEQVVFIDDTQLNCEVAREHGIRTIHHTSLESTRAALAEMGLTVSDYVKPAV